MEAELLLWVSSRSLAVTFGCLLYFQVLGRMSEAGVEVIPDPRNFRI